MRPNPPHKEVDEAKVAAMVEALDSSGGFQVLPPVVVDPSGNMAVTGSHRLAAYNRSDRNPVCIVCTDTDWTKAAEFLNCDPCDLLEKHYEDISRVLYCVTYDDDLKVALEDQF